MVSSTPISSIRLIGTEELDKETKNLAGAIWRQELREMFVSTQEILCGDSQAHLSVWVWEVFRKKFACRSHLMG